MTVTWSPQLAVGYGPIDEQHQELFRRVDSLLASIRLGCSGPEVERMMIFASDYVHQHFAEEEALMRSAGYPRLAEHREEHRALVRTLKELKVDLAKAGPTPEFVARLGAALVDWLKDHISTTDVALGTWLGAQRSPQAPA